MINVHPQRLHARNCPAVSLDFTSNAGLASTGKLVPQTKIIPVRAFAESTTKKKKKISQVENELQ